MHDARKTDALLRRALGGVEAPGDALLRQVKASLRKEQDMKTNQTTKRMLTLALAAALVVALSVTAWAAYMASVEDYIIEPPATVAPEEPQRVRLSLVGYQGTPEYEAYVEWERWKEENPADFSSVGNDDSYFETEENYAALYGAPFKNQAEKLDEIMEKYGLTLHTHRSFLLREEQYTTLGLESLCELLDMEPFIHSECDAYGGYVYDDGTFRLEASVNGDDTETMEQWEALQEKDFTMFLSAKGSFTDIYGTLPEDYEQWDYTAGGQEVTLALSDTGGVVLAELPGAYVYMSCRAKDRSSVEALADAVDFGALAARFDGTPLDLTEGMKELDERYAAWEEGYTDAHDRRLWADLPAFDSQEEEQRWVLERLGDWGWTQPPAGYSPVWTQAFCQPDGQTDDGENAYALYSSRYYFNEDEGLGLSLIYKRRFSDPALTDSITAGELETYERMYPESTAFELSGRQALYVPRDMSGPQSTLYWLDGERDLLFQLCVSGEQASLETLKGYAEALIADMDRP